MSIASKCGSHESPVARCMGTRYNLNADVRISLKNFKDSPSALVKTEAARNGPSSPIVVTLDSTIEIDDNDSNTSVVDLLSREKRRRTSSSSFSESPEKRSGNSSPEIVRRYSPATYKLRQLGDRLLIVKISMNSKQRTRRSLKCTDQDITSMLESDSDDASLFDLEEKSGKNVVTVLQNQKKTETPRTPSRSKKRSDNDKHDFPDKLMDGEILPQTPKRLQKNVADTGTPSSLKIKLRRSTEQSNYKVANYEDSPRRSTRSNVGTPKKCGDVNCDEDHSVHAALRGSRRTPKTNVLTESSARTPRLRNTRNSSKSVDYNNDTLEMKNIDNKENESETETMDDDSDGCSEHSTRNKSRSSMLPTKGAKVVAKTAITPKINSLKIDEAGTGVPRRNYLNSVVVIENSGRDDDKEIEDVERKDELATPQKRITRSGSVTPSTRKSTRPRRNSRTTYYKEDKDSGTDESYSEKNTENIRDDVATPQKRITSRGSVTPSTRMSTRSRKNSKSVCYNDDNLSDILTGDETNEDTERIGETRGYPTRRTAVTPVGTSSAQKRRKILEEPCTPKRTPRVSALRKSEEPTTPKRTPSKTAVRDLEDGTTTPRKPPTIFEVDEPTTPKTKRNVKALTPSIKHGNLTPSMTRRTANVGKPKTLLQEARAQLHVSTVPKSLPCRDDEFNDIFRFLQSKLLDNSSGCIYISGVPGTGKTATVTETIRVLKRCVDKRELADFQFVAINGMKLSEPRQAYVQILKQITGQTATWEEAHGILEKRFKKSNAKRSMTLLLVDELDLLCNKRQDVVYNLLDWPATANAHLVVITIANTMDLPERILMSRVTSRLGLTRLTFQPYTYKQLQEIVTARLKDSDAFRSEAIQLVSRKVAAVSGDARRALDICRRATEITEMKGEKTVTMQHVNEALQEMISSAKVKAIKMCSEMEILFLRAVDAEIARTGVEEVTFNDIYRQFASICAFEGILAPNFTQATGICSRLSSYRLLLCEHTKNDADRRILLNVSSDDIHFAMQTIGES